MTEEQLQAIRDANDVPCDALTAADVVQLHKIASAIKPEDVDLKTVLRAMTAMAGALLARLEAVERAIRGDDEPSD